MPRGLKRKRHSTQKQLVGRMLMYRDGPESWMQLCGQLAITKLVSPSSTNSNTRFDRPRKPTAASYSCEKHEETQCRNSERPFAGNICYRKVNYEPCVVSEIMTIKGIPRCIGK